MIKLLRNKIQSLSKAQQNILIAILVLISLGIIIFFIPFIINSLFPLMVKEEPLKETVIEQERPIIEIIQDLTAEKGTEIEPLSEEIIKNLTVPE